MFPRPPKLPPRPREVATQVVKQEQSGAVDQRVVIVEKKPAQPKVPAPPHRKTD